MGTPFSPIPNFTGSLAGQLFRNAINALFGGTTPTTPQITGGTVDGAVFGSVTPPTGALGQMSGVTPSQGDNSTNLATTAFVAGAAAPLNSPAFTGTPTAPTGAAGNNTQQIATNAFVQTSYASPPAAGLGSTTACPVNATTIAASGLISPSGGIAGRTNGAAPAAGTIGETLSSIITSGSAVSLTSGLRRMSPALLSRRVIGKLVAKSGMEGPPLPRRPRAVLSVPLQRRLLLRRDSMNPIMAALCRPISGQSIR